MIEWSVTLMPLSSNLNRVGIGSCIRDEFDSYMMAKYDQHTPICDIRVEEALGLLSAPGSMIWMILS
jgi:hypothetical protein